ncbi:MAG TPA: bi-domain-containing oxidoreductase [Terriglobales bacterium]|nr:bi-domain-containing oxidoreductase [Terriglobales bacterium]
MKQVLQNARTGKIEVADVPAPHLLPGCVLVKIAASLVSAGTERAATEFASKSLLQKAWSRPDLLREVMNKVRRDGLLPAASAVRNRLDQPLSLGYSSAGTVVEVGEGISDLRPGDRVACAGANFAVHAEFACVPRMLVARIPSSDVSFESAAFTTLGAVAIHGVRTAEAKLGDVVAVIGLGLLGQLTVQILRAAGCHVLGMDPLAWRAELAAKLGALAVSSSELEFRDLCLQHSTGNGVDSVLITAETPGSGPVNLASEVARDRAIVAAVGTVGMELQRKLYYEKELDFRISRSYGPGRYDAAFEQKARDYPIGYVRWTETRNMEAFLRLLAGGRLDLGPLITHSFAVEDALSAYDLITGKTAQPYLGVLIQYSRESNQGAPHFRRLELISPSLRSPGRTVRIGVLGAGNFAQGVLLPAMRRSAETEFAGLCTSNGARSRAAAARFGFAFCTTDETEIYSDPTINAIAIVTRHHLHAEQVVRALEHGKHVFCEKPLCLNETELQQIQRAYARRGDLKLMVGFNRRFAPMARKLSAFLAEANGPLTVHYRINSGPLPRDNWILDPEQGGGRILGEVCHFVDFLSFLCGAPPISVHARSVPGVHERDVVATLEFADGSLGTISYLCSGDRVFSKERVEVFGGGRVAALEDFRRLELVCHGRKQTFRSWLRQEKGHAAEWQAFADSVRSGSPSPIAFGEIAATTLATIRIAESLRSGSESPVNCRMQELTAPLVS